MVVSHWSSSVTIKASFDMFTNHTVGLSDDTYMTWLYSCFSCGLMWPMCLALPQRVLWYEQHEPCGWVLCCNNGVIVSSRWVLVSGEGLTPTHGSIQHESCYWPRWQNCHGNGILWANVQAGLLRNSLVQFSLKSLVFPLSCATSTIPSHNILQVYHVWNHYFNLILLCLLQHLYGLILVVFLCHSSCMGLSSQALSKGL